MAKKIEHYFSYKNSQIAYTDQGRGSALVFLHGFLENRSLWQKVAPSFEKKYRVICVDLFGHGNSENIGYIHTMEDFADMIYELISNLRLRKVTLIGHSMGGYISLAFAELYPDTVKRLVLINSTTRIDSSERLENRKRAIDAIKYNAKTFVSMATKNLFPLEFSKRSYKKVEKFSEEAQKTSIQGMIAAIEGMMLRIDREMLLHLGPYEKLMIAGEEDPIVPIENSIDECESAQIPLEILPCGHVAPLEKPKKVIEILKGFLKGK